MRARTLFALLLGVCLAPAPIAHAAGLMARARHHRLICAHRGWLSPDEVENSLVTFRHTEQVGGFMLELDLSKTRDGQIVLMHDATVDRTTTGHGAVADLDSAAIAGLRLRPRSGGPTAEAPPTFRAVLDWAARSPDVLLMLDIKTTPPGDAMALVRRAGLTSRVMLLTFDAATAARAFASDPAVAVSVLVTDAGALERYRRMAGPHRRFIAYIPVSSDAALFDAAHRDGALVVTDLLDRKDALAPGADPSVLAGKPADIVVSNRPQATRRALRIR